MATTALTEQETVSSNKKNAPRANAETMAQKQREISVSEFFAKNRHLLGFDNPRKALLTTIKEAVDNSLDACEEAGILPDLFIRIEQVIKDQRYRVTVRDNGPGIVRRQVENVFGRLLYGSKFHRLKMSRGQQGIGIAAAGMYGLMTTGKPMVIHTKPHKAKPSHKLVLAIDMQKNKADVSDEEERYDFPHDTGTEVVLEIEAKYQRGKQSVDEYLQQTAIANPHAQVIYQPPDCCQSATDGQAGQANDAMLVDDFKHAVKLASESKETQTTPGGTVVYPRGVKELPVETKEIKPHPMGVELGILLKMLKTTENTKLGGFLQNEFCRISPKLSSDIAEKAGYSGNSWVNSIDHAGAEKIYAAIQEMKFIAPPTDCLAPIGDAVIRTGLLKGIKAEFYTSVTRPPAVYRGNPFQIEIGIAYGGDLPAEEPARVIRFANRVPLLYQQSACCTFKAVTDTSWRNYGLQQPKDSLPVGPLVIMVHMASVWVPFTSESKEAIADYDEIRKEIKLAISDCGRKLKTYLNRRDRVRRESQRRNIFQKYMGETVLSLARIDPKLKAEKLLKHFQAVARTFTEKADMQFDEDGNPIEALDEGFDDSVVIIEANIARDETQEPVRKDEPTPSKRSGKTSDDDSETNGEGLFS